MTLLRRTAAAVWDFVVGDDWRVAIGAVAALGLAAVLVATGVNAWWLMPLAVPSVLALSVWHAVAEDRERRP
jgi:hypothetical protein